MPLRRPVKYKWCPKLSFHCPDLTDSSPTICVQHFSLRGLRSEGRMPKRQPCLGCEPVRNVRNFEQSVKQTRLLCTEFHELIHRDKYKTLWCRKWGRPAYTWERTLQRYCIWRGGHTWIVGGCCVWSNGCGRNRILCFLRCIMVDREKSCISFIACALKGLPSGRQDLTWLLVAEFMGENDDLTGKKNHKPTYASFSIKVSIYLGRVAKGNVQSAMWPWCTRRWFGPGTVDKYMALLVYMLVWCALTMEYYAQHSLILATHFVHNGFEKLGVATNQKLGTDTCSQNCIQDLCQDASWLFCHPYWKQNNQWIKLVFEEALVLTTRWLSLKPLAVRALNGIPKFGLHAFERVEHSQ